MLASYYQSSCQIGRDIVPIADTSAGSCRRDLGRGDGNITRHQHTVRIDRSATTHRRCSQKYLPLLSRLPKIRIKNRAPIRDLERAGLKRWCRRTLKAPHKVALSDLKCVIALTELTTGFPINAPCVLSALPFPVRGCGYCLPLRGSSDDQL